MGSKEPTTLKDQAATIRNRAHNMNSGPFMYVSRTQYRIYIGLLLFVVVVGLSILGFPSLRARLSTRIQTLYAATNPLSINALPARAKVGENRHPFPAEFERPGTTRSPYPGIIDLANKVYKPRGVGSRAEPAPSEPVEPSESAGGANPIDAPEFRQGQIEQEAYELVLRSSETVAGMVRGTNPSLRFKSWSAAKRAADTFLVDVTFTKAPENVEVHYVWQVRLSSREVKPESHNARALSNP